MRSAIAGLALSLVCVGCSSGLFARDATDQVDRVELEVLKGALSDVARSQATYLVETGHFSNDLSQLDVSAPPGVVLDLEQSSLADYCVIGTHESLAGVLWHVSSDETVPAEGPC